MLLFLGNSVILLFLGSTSNFERNNKQKKFFFLLGVSRSYESRKVTVLWDGNHWLNQTTVVRLRWIVRSMRGKNAWNFWNGSVQQNRVLRNWNGLCTSLMVSRWIFGASKRKKESKYFFHVIMFMFAFSSSFKVVHFLLLEKVTEFFLVLWFIT